MNRMILKICLLILSGIVYTCFLHPPTVFSQVQGFVKDRNGNALANVSITVDQGFSTCSNSRGWYSLVLTPGRDNSITYRKNGYKFQKKVEPIIDDTANIHDISLVERTAQKELWGFVGDRKQGVKVNLYRKDSAGESYVDTAITCSDGMYSFSELADGIYKIAPECSVCTFSPAFRDNVQIPCTATATFDFKASCTPGACQ